MIIAIIATLGAGGGSSTPPSKGAEVTFNAVAVTFNAVAVTHTT